MDRNTSLEAIYGALHIPVLACSLSWEPVYYNASARLFFYPQTKKPESTDNQPISFDSLGFKDDTKMRLIENFEEHGFITNFPAAFVKSNREDINAVIQANKAQIGPDYFYILYLQRYEDSEPPVAERPGGMLSAAFHLVNHCDNAHDAIQKLLGFIGAFTQATRVYIVEEQEGAFTLINHEWYADGLSPLNKTGFKLPQHELQPGALTVSKRITENGQASSKDYGFLKQQGIKSLAATPLLNGEKPIGYINYDGITLSAWSGEQISLLHSMADIMVSLLLRHHMELKANRSSLMLQRISDNIDSPVYVSDMETHEILFVNKAISLLTGLPASELLGKKCYEVLQTGMREPCDFCPLNIMLDKDRNVLMNSYIWERQNPATKKWFLLRDNIFTSPEGKAVHIETATDITHQKQYEEQLQFIASVDTLTGVYNREWGYKIMSDMTTGPQAQIGDLMLVFIDVDGLKHVNDHFGHQMGDEMLINTIEVIRSCVRRSDIIIRWGGDEFIILLQCKESMARIIMKNIEKQMELFNAKNDKPYKLSYSYGIEDLRQNTRNLDAAITNADQSMYINKIAKQKTRIG